MGKALEIHKRFEAIYGRTDPWEKYCYRTCLACPQTPEGGVPLTDNDHDRSVGFYIKVTYWEFDQHPELEPPSMFEGMRVEVTILPRPQKLVFA